MKQTETEFLNELDKQLWTAANKLLPMLDAAVYKHVVLGLIFLKYVSDAFITRRKELEAAFRNPKNDYYLGKDAEDMIPGELEARDYYTEKNVFWVPALARWDFIQANAKVAVGTVLKVKNGKATEYKFNGIGRRASWFRSAGHAGIELLRTACLFLILSFCSEMFCDSAYALGPLAGPYPIFQYDADGRLNNGAIAIAGNTLAVAGGDSKGNLIFIYQLNNGVWIESARLHTSDKQVTVNSATDFGASIAISSDGNTIFVGDPTAACTSNSTLPCGAIDVYDKPSGGWADTDTPDARLTPSTGTYSQELGTDIALSSDDSTLAALGDAVYVFSKPAAGWTSAGQTAVLGNPTGTGLIQSGAEYAVSVDGDVVANNTTGETVLVYVKSTATWQNSTSATAVLSNSSSGFDDLLGDFGSRLKVSGDLIVLGAPEINTALLYQKPSSGWATTNTATAVLQTPAGSIDFGIGVNIVGGSAVITDASNLYTYDEPGSGWSSEFPTAQDSLPSEPSPYLANFGYDFGGIYVSGSEVATSANSQCNQDSPPLCTVGSVFTPNSISNNYSGLLISSASITDLTSNQLNPVFGLTGDQLEYDFVVENTPAPSGGTATFNAQVTGGTLTDAAVGNSNYCKISNGKASCTISLNQGQSETVKLTVQTSAMSKSASMAANLSSVSPLSWDAIASSLSDSLTLKPAPIVPAQVTFKGSPGSTISDVLPVSYGGTNKLVYMIIAQPNVGTLTVNKTTGSFSWSPGRSFNGSTVFTYKVSDGVHTSANCDVTLDESGSGSGSGSGGAISLISLILLGAIGFRKWIYWQA